MTSDDLGLAQSPVQAAEGDEAMVERVARVLAPPAWAVAGTRHDRPWLAASRRFSIRNAKAAIEVMRPALSAEGSATIAAARKQAAEEMRERAAEDERNRLFALLPHDTLLGTTIRRWLLEQGAMDPFDRFEERRLGALPPSSSPEDQQKAAATPTIADPDGEARS